MPGPLAAKVRAKYPGAYDDIPDDQLERQVLAKYPEYADLAQPDPAPEGDQLLENVKNIGRFVGRVAKSAYDHPAQALGTAGAMAAVPLTGGSSLLPSIAAAGLGGAGGAGLGHIVGALKGDADTPSTAGGVLASMGTEGLTQAAGQGTGALAAGAMRGSLRLMRSALKTPDALVKARMGAGFRSKDDIARAVLEEGRYVSPGQLGKAQGALDATDDAAQQAIRSGAGKGVQVDTRQVADAIGNTASARGPFGRQINAQPDVSAVKSVREAFVNNPEVSDPIGGMSPLPADVAHQFASNTGKNLSGKFGRLGAATVEAEKAGRANITSQLRQGIPELEPLWAQEAKQITVRDALEKATERERNRDILGLTGVVGMVKNPALAATALSDRSALVKSLLAQGLRKLQGPLSMAPDAVRLALLARLQEQGTQ